MPTDLPALVSAEAAVKSKRSDYVSLFDPKVDLNDLKKCRSDPALMKQAVKSLKEAGFVVTSVGGCSVGIEGAPSLFEKTFSTKLVAVALPGNAPQPPQTWAVSAAPANQKGGVKLGALISIAATSPFAPFLDSVLLDPPAAPTSGTRSKDGNARDEINPNVIYCSPSNRT